MEKTKTSFSFTLLSIHFFPIEKLYSFAVVGLSDGVEFESALFGVHLYDSCLLFDVLFFRFIFDD